MSHRRRVEVVDAVLFERMFLFEHSRASRLFPRLAVTGAAVALLAGTIQPAPAAAAPATAVSAPPLVTMPAAQIVTGSADITIRGTALAGASVVVFLDMDRNGRFHSVIDYSWYRRVQADGTFEVPVFLHRLDGPNPDLFALTDTGSEQSTLVKLPTIVHQTGAPVAAAPVAPPAPAPAPAPNTVLDVPAAPVPDEAAIAVPNTVFDLGPALAVEPHQFQVGDAIEFRGFVGDAWQPGKVVAINQTAYATTYLVEYRNVVGLVETMVFPDNVRAPEGVPAPAVPVAGGPLVMGAYSCQHYQWTAPPPNGRLAPTQMGSFTLFAGGTYTWLDNGEGGTYAYDPTTGAITWLSGYFAAGQPEQSAFRQNSARTAQVDILWTGVYTWSCGINL